MWNITALSLNNINQVIIKVNFTLIEEKFTKY